MLGKSNQRNGSARCASGPFQAADFGGACRFSRRAHLHSPARGRVAIYNRSHYEDVLVVRAREPIAERGLGAAFVEWLSDRPKLTMSAQPRSLLSSARLSMAGSPADRGARGATVRSPASANIAAKEIRYERANLAIVPLPPGTATAAH
jgi:hypothetical protein